MLIVGLFSEVPVPQDLCFMITEIQRFCEAFAQDLSPFSRQLDEALGDIRSHEEIDPLRSLAPTVSDVRHSLKTLSDKIESQQAYLLIFGPLKSGKSTLMNSLAGRYVSEVSSLPAYPCLVYVAHGEKQAFAITNYNGIRHEFTTNDEMQRKIDADHEALADRIVEVEKRGETFEPGVHFPEAIRRIDITLPAESLKASGTVLVDTPGLYSRMKFGYDLMTREFRNFAACAVFVVKTDNLFLEQVFDEFNDLLGYFSRIFLIVNIDTSKQDLAPDGTLKPSLERMKPERVIEAFRSLTMNASLREAYEQGRLRIYPVDLLQAASEKLRGTTASDLEGDIKNAVEALREDGEGDSTEDTDAALESRVREFTETSSDENLGAGGQGYRAFISDLTDYLNSSDYLHEFMFDSLRQGRQLADEIDRLSASEELERRNREEAELSEEIQVINDKLQAARTLRQAKLVTALDPEQIKGEDLITEEKRAFTEKLAQRLHDNLSGWYEGDDTLEELQAKYVNEPIAFEEEPIYDRLTRKIKFVVDSAEGGVQASKESLRALDRLGFSLDSLIRDSFRHFASEVPKPSLKLTLDTSRIPVRKGFWDWVLFRSQTNVNRSFLGENLDKKIPSGTKQKRLGGSAKEHLVHVIDQHLGQEIPARLRAYLDAVLKHHAERVRRRLEEKLNATEADLAERKKAADAKLNETQKILTVLRKLHEASASFLERVEDLRTQYAGGATSQAELVESMPDRNGAEPPSVPEDSETSSEEPAASRS